MEVEEPSLYLSRENLLYNMPLDLQLTHRIQFKVNFPPHISEDTRQLYKNKPKAIASFGLRIEPLLQSAHINQDKIEGRVVV